MTARAIPPHRARLPDPAGRFKDLDKLDRDFFVELVAALQRELDQRVLLRSPRDELLLDAPNGSVYAVTVNDLGALAVTLRSQAP